MPGSTDTYIPLGTSTYSPRQCMQHLDPQIPVLLTCCTGTYSPVVPVPTHLVSAEPGYADTYLPVGTGTFSTRHCSAWIHRYLSYLPVVPVPTHLVSAKPGYADTYVPVGTGTYSPRQCSAWICRCLSYIPVGTGTFSPRQSRARIRRYLHTVPVGMVPTHLVSAAPGSANTCPTYL